MEKARNAVAKLMGKGKARRRHMLAIPDLEALISWCASHCAIVLGCHPRRASWFGSQAGRTSC